MGSGCRAPSREQARGLADSERAQSFLHHDASVLVEPQGRAPQVRKVSFLTWPEVSIPQNTIPVTIKGRKYLVEFDEYDSGEVAEATRDAARADAFRARADKLLRAAEEALHD